MSKLDMDIRAADELGISYGKYIAMTYRPGQTMATPQKKKRNRPPRRFTDAQAFALWQDGMTDAEIGKIVNVSRAFIQRWRDQLELPSTARKQIDTKKYRLAKLQDGTAVVLYGDDL
jgi:hypothetical protein